ncbi:M50 family metallopeptidase [Candidatus Woesearchaeota archaeon]|nr:M50 family metallopeptidase [Candidatus Woesearchaeota archaeon]
MFSLNELLDIVIMTLAIGFIFKDVFMPKRHTIVDTDHYDPLAHYRSMGNRIGSRIDINGFVFAMIITAPAVILHEFGHKLLALQYGMSAEFHAAYFWLGLGVLLKLLNFGFIFFVPAYVSISGSGLTYFQSSAIAFAGPAVNLLLFIVPFVLLKNAAFRKKYKKYLSILFLTSRINLFLFVFNMLPLPMFDGWKVFSGLIHAFF